MDRELDMIMHVLEENDSYLYEFIRNAHYGIEHSASINHIGSDIRLALETIVKDIYEEKIDKIGEKYVPLDILIKKLGSMKIMPSNIYAISNDIRKKTNPRNHSNRAVLEYDYKPIFYSLLNLLKWYVNYYYSKECHDISTIVKNEHITDININNGIKYIDKFIDFDNIIQINNPKMDIIDIKSIQGKVAYAKKIDAYNFVNFSKNAFKDRRNKELPKNVLNRFVKTFYRILFRFAQYVQQVKNNDEIFGSCTIDDNWRLFWLYHNRNFDIIACSQQPPIMNEQKDYAQNYTGNVRWKPDALLSRLYVMNNVARDNMKANYRNFMTSIVDENHYIYDEDQIRLIDNAVGSTEKTIVSVVGNAGSGKSLIGSQWLNKFLEIGENCLYLTLSPQLTKVRKDIFEKNSDIIEKEAINTDLEIVADKRKMTFSSIFDFLMDNANKFGGEGFVFLTPVASYSTFEKICQEGQVGWGRIPGKSFDSKKQFVWREIHGLIKGALPHKDELEYTKDRIKLLDCLKEYEYIKKLDSRKVNKVIKDFIYKKYHEYRIYLEKNKLKDDNDLARFVLQNAKPLDNVNATFIDECQDLTEVQLLAVFHLVSRATHKFIASDRCQMVQPTFFDPSFAVSVANRINGGIVYKTPRLQYLSANFRSTEEVVNFQNYIMNRLKKVMSLHEEEKIAISPKSRRHDYKPVWIRAKSGNWEIIKNDFLQARKLKTIVSSYGDDDIREYVNDVIDCKGMEFPSVLLLNVLSKMTQSIQNENDEWRWKYFYVGATRAQTRLLIYEERADDNEFFREAVENGYIDECIDLKDVEPRSGLSWQEYLTRWINDIAIDECADLAHSYYELGKYEIAAELCRNDEDRKEKYYWYAGKSSESKGDYPQALDCYMQMEKSTELLINLCKLNIPKDVYIAARLWMIDVDNPAGLMEIKKDFSVKYKKEYSISIDELMKKYPVLEEKIKDICESRWKKIYEQIEYLEDKFTELVEEKKEELA